MPAPVPPAAVRALMAKGCMGNFTPAGSAFNPDESIALARWFARLAATRSPEANDALTDTLAAVAGASLARHQPVETLACAKGCGSCCHQKVSVNAVEIFTVARRLRKSKALVEHRARLAARPTRGDPASPSRVLDPAKPCSFLVADACSIHAIRPTVCRTMASLDVRACLRRFAAGDGDIPVPRASDPVRLWLNTALWSALAAARLEIRTYDFEGGVAAMLADPGIEARWYAGDDGLVGVADPPLPAAALPEIARLRAMARL